MLEPSRPPTTESASTTSTTVAVRAGGADDAADEAVVVEHGHVGVDAGGGAGVDGDGVRERLRGAERDDVRRDQGVAGAAGGAGQALQLGQPVAVEVGGLHRAAELGVLGLEPGEVAAQVVVVRK